MLPDEAALLESVEGPVVASDETGTIAYLNAPAQNLFGWLLDDVVGKPLTVLMPARMHTAHRAGIRRYLETRRSHLLGKAVRVPAVRSDGEEFEIELTLRMFRRPDGSDLIVALVHKVAPGEPAKPNVLQLETQLMRRAYELV